MTLQILKSLLTIIVLVYLGLGALLYFFQQHFIYFPNAEIVDDSTPSVKIKSGNETIKVWIANTDKKDAVLFFGGNAANAYFALPQFERMVTDKTVYLIDYRGYGGSSGRPSEASLYSDAITIYDHVKHHHENISIIGQSLGSGIAVYLATQRDIENMILSTPYDSLESVAKEHYPFYPVSWFLKEKYDSFSRAESITAKTLILIAEKDRIIPKKHAYRLASAFNPDLLTIVELPGVGHNTLTLHPRYESVITGFLK